MPSSMRLAILYAIKNNNLQGLKISEQLLTEEYSIPS